MTAIISHPYRIIANSCSVVQYREEKNGIRTSLFFVSVHKMYNKSRPIAPVMSPSYQLNCRVPTMVGADVLSYIKKFWNYVKRNAKCHSGLLQEHVGGNSKPVFDRCL